MSDTKIIQSEEFFEKYGNAEVKFQSYYKYIFTFYGELDSGFICVSVGGDSDEIYGEDISAEPCKINDLNINSANVYDADKNLVESCYFGNW